MRWDELLPWYRRIEAGDIEPSQEMSDGQGLYAYPGVREGAVYAGWPTGILNRGATVSGRPICGDLTVWVEGPGAPPRMPEHSAFFRQIEIWRRAGGSSAISVLLDVGVHGVDPLTPFLGAPTNAERLLPALQLLFFSEHLKYWWAEHRGGGRYLPLNIMDGLLTDRIGLLAVAAIEWKTGGRLEAERLLGGRLPYRGPYGQASPCRTD